MQAPMQYVGWTGVLRDVVRRERKQVRPRNPVDRRLELGGWQSMHKRRTADKWRWQDRHLIILASAMFAASAATASAQPSSDAAGTSCAQFLKARTNDPLHRQVSNWLYGYAS